MAFTSSPRSRRQRATPRSAALRRRPAPRGKMALRGLAREPQRAQPVGEAADVAPQARAQRRVAARRRSTAASAAAHSAGGSAVEKTSERARFTQQLRHRARRSPRRRRSHRAPCPACPSARRRGSSPSCLAQPRAARARARRSRAPRRPAAPRRARAQTSASVRAAARGPRPSRRRRRSRPACAAPACRASSRVQRLDVARAGRRPPARARAGSRRRATRGSARRRRRRRPAPTSAWTARRRSPRSPQLKSSAASVPSKRGERAPRARRCAVGVAHHQPRGARADAAALERRAAPARASRGSRGEPEVVVRGEVDERLARRRGPPGPAASSSGSSERGAARARPSVGQLLARPGVGRPSSRAAGASRPAAPAAGCPRLSSSAMSSAYSGLPVVSSFSPKKIELAPAIMQSSCASWLICIRPADSRTIAARHQDARGGDHPHHLDRRRPASGSPAACPSPRTSALIGTDSGCASWFASVREQLAAIVDRLAHADDAAAADGDAGLAHARQRARAGRRRCGWR